MRLCLPRCPVRTGASLSWSAEEITSGFWAGAFRDLRPRRWFLDGVA